MTLLMYARRKGWDLTECSVHLAHDRVHAEDSADAEKGTRWIDVIKRDISLHGRLDEEQKARLLDIARKCPISKTLLNQPRIIDSISVGE